MWLNTSCTAYWVRSLHSRVGMSWVWRESEPDGEFGIGERSAFDDYQRCYTCVVPHRAQLRCWYAGNGFGATGIGYATGTPAAR